MVGQESDSTTVSYVVNLYADIENLLNIYAGFLNTALYVQVRYLVPHKKEIDELVDEQEKANYIRSLLLKMESGDSNLWNQSIYDIRFYTTRIYVKFNALKDEIKAIKDNFNELEELYKKIQESYSPKTEDTEKFVIKINEMFVKGLGKELNIKTQQDVEGMGV